MNHHTTTLVLPPPMMARRIAAGGAMINILLAVVCVGRSPNIYILRIDVCWIDPLPPPPPPKKDWFSDQTIHL